jgi:inner membrane protein involved in colicin E2 resistance
VFWGHSLVGVALLEVYKLYGVVWAEFIGFTSRFWIKAFSSSCLNYFKSVITVTLLRWKLDSIGAGPENFVTT